jgi:hypothetical protein
LGGKVASGLKMQANRAIEAERKLLKVERAHHREVQRGKELDAEIASLQEAILREKTEQAKFGQGALKNLGSSNLAQEAQKYRGKVLNRLEELFSVAQREENALQRKGLEKRNEINALRKEALALNEEFLLHSNALDSAKLRLSLFLEQANAIVLARGAIASRVEALRQDLIQSRSEWLEERTEVTAETHRLLAASFLTGSKKKKRHEKLMAAINSRASTPALASSAGAIASARGGIGSARPGSSGTTGAAGGLLSFANTPNAQRSQRRATLTTSASTPLLVGDRSAYGRIDRLMPMSATLLRRGPLPMSSTSLTATAAASAGFDTSPESAGSSREGEETSRTDLVRPRSSPHPPSGPGSPKAEGAATQTAAPAIMVGSLTPQEEEKLTIKARRMKALVEAFERDAPRQANLLHRWEEAFKTLHEAAVNANAALHHEGEISPEVSLQAMVAFTPKSPLGIVRSFGRGDEEKKGRGGGGGGEAKEGDSALRALRSRGSEGGGSVGGGLPSSYEDVIADPTSLIKAYLKHDANCYAKFVDLSELGQQLEMVEEQIKFLEEETRALAASRASASRLQTVKELEGRIQQLRECNMESVQEEKVLNDEVARIRHAVGQVAEEFGFDKEVQPEALLSTLGLIERRTNQLVTSELASLFPPGTFPAVSSSSGPSSAVSSVVFAGEPMQFQGGGSVLFAAVRPPSVGDKGGLTTRADIDQQQQAANATAAGGLGVGGPYMSPVAAALQEDYELLRRNRRASLASIVEGAPTMPPGPAAAAMALEASTTPTVVPRPNTSYSRSTSQRLREEGGDKEYKSGHDDDISAGGDGGRGTKSATASNKRGSLLPIAASSATGGGGGNTSRTSSSSGRASSSRSRERAAPTSSSARLQEGDKKEEHAGGTTTLTSPPLFLVERVPGKISSMVGSTMAPMTPAAVASAIKARANRASTLEAARASLMGGQGIGGEGEDMIAAAAAAAASGAAGGSGVGSPTKKTVPLAMTSLLTQKGDNRLFFAEAGHAGAAGGGASGRSGEDDDEDSIDRRRRWSTSSSSINKTSNPAAAKSNAALNDQYQAWLQSQMPQTSKAIDRAKKKKEERKQKDEKAGIQRQLAMRPLSSVKLQALPKHVGAKASQRGGGAGSTTTTARPPSSAALPQAAPPSLTGALASSKAKEGQEQKDEEEEEEGGALGEVDSAVMLAPLDSELQFINAETGALLVDDDDENDGGGYEDDEDEAAILAVAAATSSEDYRELKEKEGFITKEVDEQLQAVVGEAAGGSLQHKTLRAKTRSLDNLEKAFELAVKASARLGEAEKRMKEIKDARGADLGAGIEEESAGGGVGGSRTARDSKSLVLPSLIPSIPSSDSASGGSGGGLGGTSAGGRPVSSTSTSKLARSRSATALPVASAVMVAPPMLIAIEDRLRQRALEQHQQQQQHQQGEEKEVVQEEGEGKAQEEGEKEV